MGTRTARGVSRDELAALVRACVWPWEYPGGVAAIRAQYQPKCRNHKPTRNRAKAPLTGGELPLTRDGLAAAIERLRPDDYDWRLGELFGASHTTIRRKRIDWGLPTRSRNKAVSGS